MLLFYEQILFTPPLIWSIILTLAVKVADEDREKGIEECKNG